MLPGLAHLGVDTSHKRSLGLVGFRIRWLLCFEQTIDDRKPLCNAHRNPRLLAVIDNAEASVTMLGNPFLPQGDLHILSFFEYGVMKEQVVREDDHLPTGFCLFHQPLCNRLHPGVVKRRYRIINDDAVPHADLFQLGKKACQSKCALFPFAQNVAVLADLLLRLQPDLDFALAHLSPVRQF